MRIAVSGTHGSGKSTLIEDFCAAHPDYQHVQEPYWELAQRGVTFADGATSGDLEEQLAQSCALIAQTAGADVIFDRCPFDFIAYLEVVSRQEAFDWEPGGKLLPRIEKALAMLDLVVFLPLSSPDEIAVAIELPKLRARVDQRLKRLLRDDEAELLGEGPRLLEITGTRAERLQRLSAALTGR
jgi:hypothetical protein